jgi:hypothetical protein
MARRTPDGNPIGCLAFLFLLIAVPAMLNSCMSDDQGGDYAPTYAPYLAPPSIPSLPPYTGPVTLCRDGWVSHSTGRGTCSHHGGEG